jgi:hypothetical protein
MSLTGLYWNESISVILLQTNRTPGRVFVHCRVANKATSFGLEGWTHESWYRTPYSLQHSVLSVFQCFLLDVSLIVKVSPTFKGSATQFWRLHGGKETTGVTNNDNIVVKSTSGGGNSISIFHGVTCVLEVCSVDFLVMDRGLSSIVYGRPAVNRGREVPM